VAPGGWFVAARAVTWGQLASGVEDDWFPDERYFRTLALRSQVRSPA
jgi:hypothetical protein